MRKASFLSPDFPIQECHLKECKNVTASWCVFHVECSELQLLSPLVEPGNEFVFQLRGMYLLHSQGFQARRCTAVEQSSAGQPIWSFGFL